MSNLISADAMRKFATPLLLAYIFFTVTVPALWINKLIFAILIFFGIFFEKIELRKFLIFLTIIIINIFGVAVSLISKQRIDYELMIQLAVTPAALFVYFYIAGYNIEAKKIINITGLIVIISSLVYYWAIAYETQFGVLYFDLFKKYNFSSAGFRDFITEDSLFFYAALGTTPYLLLPLYVKIFYDKPTKLNLLYIAAALIVILISGARAVFMMAIIYIIAQYIVNSMHKKITIPVILILFIIIFILIASNTNLFSSAEGSNAVKLGHINSYLNSVTAMQLLLGDGLGSFYYSEGRDEFVAHTEILIFDYFRYMGILIAVVHFTLYLFPSSKIKKILHSPIFYFIISYFIVGQTNPIFMNSLGMLVISLAWKLYDDYHEKNNK